MQVIGDSQLVSDRTVTIAAQLRGARRDIPVGLALLFKRTGIPVSSIRCVEVSEYLRGGPVDSAPLDPSRYAPSRLPLGRSKPRSFVTLSLIDADERTGSITRAAPLPTAW